MPAWGDPAILNEILRVGRSIRNPRIRRIYERAAVQTGLVESGGRNLSGGDADSAGWRQERASLYRNPTNVRASVKRFRDEFLQQYDPGEKSYQVAAQVQRPREDLRGRYHDVAREAAQLLKGRGTSGGSGLEQLLAGDTAGARQMPQGSEGVAALLATLGEKPQVPSSGGLQAPAFSARAAMPAGAQVPEGSAPAPKQDIDGLLAAVRTLGGDIAHAPGTDAVSGAAGGSTGAAKGAPAHGSAIKELIWAGQGSQFIDNGKFVAPYAASEHKDHVHVAAGPKTVDALGRLAQSMGLSVGENETFGPVHQVHTGGSFHYSDRAIDVSGDPKKMAAFARRVAAYQRAHR